MEGKKRRLVGVAKGAERLGASVWTLRRKCYSGEVASHKWNGRLMISEDEIDRIIRESERPRIKGASNAA